MITFFDSTHCKSEAHCSACRDRKDPSFRTSVAASFGDVGGANYACPIDKPWNHKRKIKLHGRKIYKDGKRCSKCEKRNRSNQH